jgi:hypothetical protein
MIFPAFSNLESNLYCLQVPTVAKSLETPPVNETSVLTTFFFHWYFDFQEISDGKKKRKCKKKTINVFSAGHIKPENYNNKK